MRSTDALGRHRIPKSTHALLSISNIQYWRESHRYFAPNSEELALLHCWSLSAEEQFYLVWPVLIVLATKFAPSMPLVATASSAAVLRLLLEARHSPLVGPAGAS
jgi:peptidoglycan/LPS O-acetylase OafA/YrhL